MPCSFSPEDASLSDAIKSAQRWNSLLWLPQKRFEGFSFWGVFAILGLLLPFWGFALCGIGGKTFAVELTNKAV